MKPTLYTTITTMAWTKPPNLEVYPTIPMNFNAFLRYQLQLQHDKGQIIYYNMGTMDESLNNQAIDTAEDKYLKELNNKYTGFLGVT